MTVRATIDGRVYTATRNYQSVQHSGAAEDARRMLPGWALSALRKTGVSPSDLEGGDVTVVVDGVLVSRGMSKWPESEVGSADAGGFGFGGLGAQIDVLNYGYTANQSFSVRKDGATDWGQDAFVTTVDGEVKETGEFRPYMITWESGGGTGVSL